MQPKVRKTLLHGLTSLILCSLVSGALGGGTGSTACAPEEMRWSARQWREYLEKGQRAVRDAYREVERVEQERAEARRNQVKIVPRGKDRFGDPMYVTYGPRAYAGTPQYVGPRYASSFVPRSLALPYQGDALCPTWAIYAPSAPAKSDIVLKPSASRPY